MSGRCESAEAAILSLIQAAVSAGHAQHPRDPRAAGEVAFDAAMQALLDAAAESPAVAPYLQRAADLLRQGRVGL